MSTLRSTPLADISKLERLIEEVWQRGELDAIDELYEEQFVGHDPSRETPVYGRGELRLRIAGLRQAFPDLSIELDDILISGDRAAYRYVARGTHRGQLVDLAATGRRVTVTGIDIVRFGFSGRIAEQWTWWDALGLHCQLRRPSAESS
jgi:steroid delta-isomerase-like uncharacterized protein